MRLPDGPSGARAGVYAERQEAAGWDIGGVRRRHDGFSVQQARESERKMAFGAAEGAKGRKKSMKTGPVCDVWVA